MSEHQSVNGTNEGPDEDLQEDVNAGINRSGHVLHGSAPGEMEEILAANAPEVVREAAPADDLGPCLYLGPAGERCSRRAVHDGFCGRHQPGASPIVSGNPKKVMAAAIAIIGILLPYLIDLLRELARLLPR